MEVASKVPPKKHANKPSSSANARKRKRKVPSNIDGWMPTVGDLQQSFNATTPDRSNIVRIHCLPKFFHGIHPSLVFVLPFFAHRIRGWDARYSNHGYSKGAKVKRHDATFHLSNLYRRWWQMRPLEDWVNRSDWRGGSIITPVENASWSGRALL